MSEAAMRVSIGYRPRPLQATLHKALKRFSVLVMHRRFGKTVMAVAELIDRALRCELPRPRLAYIAPHRNQAKTIAWDYLKAYSRAIPDVQFNEAELRADFPNGARITLYGADNPDALRGIYLDFCVMDEFAQMSERMWSEIIRPALSDRLGGVLFIGTPMGHGAFYDLYQFALKEGGDWFAACYRASESGVLDPAELEAARREMADEDRYNQEFECSFEAAIRGAYYAKLLAEADREKRICRIPWEPKAEVITAWDLGIGDSTAIWFAQRVNRELRIIDYYEASGVGLDHYVKLLREKPYTFGRHYLPHDVEVSELGTGKTRLETLRSLGLTNITVVAKLGVDDGINAARMVLPTVWFDDGKCAQGLEALRQYRAEYDEKLHAFKSRPLHDWTSHAADAFRYLAVGLQEEPRARKPLVHNTRNMI